MPSDDDHSKDPSLAPIRTDSRQDSSFESDERTIPLPENQQHLARLQEVCASMVRTAERLTKQLEEIQAQSARTLEMAAQLQDSAVVKTIQRAAWTSDAASAVSLVLERSEYHRRHEETLRAVLGYPRILQGLGPLLQVSENARSALLDLPSFQRSLAPATLGLGSLGLLRSDSWSHNLGYDWDRLNLGLGQVPTLDLGPSLPRNIPRSRKTLQCLILEHGGHLTQTQAEYADLLIGILSGLKTVRRHYSLQRRLRYARAFLRVGSKKLHKVAVRVLLELLVPAGMMLFRLPECFIKDLIFTANANSPPVTPLARTPRVQPNAPNLAA